MSGWWGTAECRLVTALRKRGVYVTSRVRCAVRYAAMTGATIAEAALVFEINPGAVWNCWERMFPDVPQPRRLTRRQSEAA